MLSLDILWHIAGDRANRTNFWIRTGYVCQMRLCTLLRYLMCSHRRHTCFIIRGSEVRPLWSVVQGHGFKSHAGAFRTSHLMTKLQGLDAVVEVHLHRKPMEIKFKVLGDCCMETVWQSYMYPSLQVIDSNPMLELCRMSCLRTCLSGLDVFVDQSISSSLKPVQTWWRLVKADHRYISTGLIWSARSRRRKPLKSCNIITDVLFWVYYACKL